MSYYHKRSNISSSRCDNDYDDEVTSCEIDNKVFDEVVIENHHAPCSDLYGEYSNVMTNPFSDCKEPLEDYGLASNFDIDYICEYKSNWSFENHSIINKDTQFQGMFDLSPQVEYEAYILKIDSMHDSFNENYFQFEANMFEHVD